MMGSSKKSRSKKMARRQRSNEDFPDNIWNFKTILSAIQSPEGMKSDVLKNLYGLLDGLSSNAKWSEYAVGSQVSDLEICHGGVKATFADIYELSNILFRQLEEMFEQLFSNLCAGKDLGDSSSSSGLFDVVEAMNLLCRCCMLLLTLLDPREDLILENCSILLRILGKLSSQNLVENTEKHAFVFEKSVFRECAPSDNGCSTSSVEGVTASLQFLEPCNPLRFFMSTMLEVFIDELSVHGQLSNYFRMTNSVASFKEMLFSSQSAHGDMVIEAICNHFILTFSDKQAFGDFLSRLFWMHAIELKYPYRAPALSVTTAVSLLLSPVMVSTPKYMQAHLISLVSETVCIKTWKPDCKLINCFLSTFEKSVILYMRHMSCLQTDGCSIFYKGFTSSSSHDIGHLPFDLFITRETKSKVDSLITELDKSSNPNLNYSFFRMKSDLVSSSMIFVKECQDAYALSCQDEILAILSCLVLKASESYDDEAIRRIEGTTLQHLYLLASLLKLMSISLLQAVRSLRQSDDFCFAKDFSSCKEYEFILGAITCFRDLDISLPLQQVLLGVMSSHSGRHMDSKMMFLHFSGLMSLSFDTGLDCLVKACLLIILALLNLFVFEDGDLDALESLVDSSKEIFSSGLPVFEFQETVVDQNSSLVVASKFHKIQSLYSSVIENKYNGKGTSSSQALVSALEMHMEAVPGLEETEETSNGEIFFKCLSKMGNNVSDVDDLLNFVECKQGKDYSAWLKNRQKFRRWRSEKIAVLRWKRKKKIWKTLKGKKNNL